MKKEGQLISIAINKPNTLQIELILEERQKKSDLGNNGSNEKGTNPVLINQINNEDQNNVIAFRKMNIKARTKI
jgi:hypothetical protein